MATLIDNTETMEDFNNLLRVWEKNFCIPIKVFEFYLQQVSYATYKGGRSSHLNIKQKVWVKDKTGFPVCKTKTLNWYEADQKLSGIVNWCYAILNKMSYDYDIDVNSIYPKDIEGK